MEICIELETELKFFKVLIWKLNCSPSLHVVGDLSFL